MNSIRYFMNLCENGPVTTGHEQGMNFEQLLKIVEDLGIANSSDFINYVKENGPGWYHLIHSGRGYFEFDENSFYPLPGPPELPTFSIDDDFSDNDNEVLSPRLIPSEEFPGYPGVYDVTYDPEESIPEDFTIELCLKVDSI